MNTTTERMRSAHTVVRELATRFADDPNPTKKAVRKALSALSKAGRKGLTIQEGVPAIIDLASAVREERRRLGRRRHAPVAAKSLPGRLWDRSRPHVVKAAKRALRYGAAAGFRFNVRYPVPGEAVSYDVVMEQDYEVYGGAYKGWAAVRDVHNIVIPQGYLLRVREIGDGSGVVDGRLLLDAKQTVVSQDGRRRIYSATSVRQGRGYSVVVEDVYVSCWDDVAVIRRTFKAACEDEMPAVLVERERAERARIERERAEQERAERARAEADECDMRALAEIEI